MGASVGLVRLVVSSTAATNSGGLALALHVMFTGGKPAISPVTLHDKGCVCH